MTRGRLSPVGRRIGDARARLCARGRRGGEDGFILLESIVAISLITVIMGALATFTINAVNTTGEQRARQAAAQLATDAMSTLRSLPASQLVAGRGVQGAKDQITRGSLNTVVQPYLNKMSNDLHDLDPRVPDTAGPDATVSTDTTTTPLNNVTYKIDTYLGECVVLSSSSDCLAGTTGTKYIRAVVAVTWPDSTCPTSITNSTVATCTYVTSTLFSREDDPIFNIGQTVATAPVPVNPGAQTSTVGASVAVQLGVRSGTGVPTYTWSPNVTAPLPAGLTLDASGLVSGFPTAVAAATPVTVMVTDAFGRTGSMTFTWTVVAAPTVTKPAAQSTAVGQAVNLAVASTCPNSPCTFALAGAPAGLTINATTGVITGAPTTAGTSAGVTVTITDADNVAATTAPFTWTVVTGPTIGAPGTLTATIGNAKAVALAYTCPGPPCTLTLAGTGTNILGLGLAATAVTTNNNVTTLNLAAASGTVYIAGTVQTTAITTGTSRVYTPTVKITNNGSGANVTSPAGTWTIFAKPTVGAVGTRTVNVGAPTNVPIAYSCPNAPCTLTLVNTAAAKVPGLGLSAVDGATATNNTASLVVAATGGTVYINGTVAGTAVTTGQTQNYAMSLSITDSTSVASAASTGTWTASKAPKVVNPGTQAIEPYQTVSLQMAASCPNGGCTWAAQVQVAGDPTWYTIPIGSTGLINYPNAPPGSYTVRITVTDSLASTDTVFFGLSVQQFTLTIPNQSTSRPGVFTLGVAPLVSPVADGYTYAITSANKPTWLSIDPNTGVLTATLTGATPLGTSTITVTVTSRSSSTSVVSSTFNWNVT
jgi:type II secretory pathway pseudopilin PulG